MTLLCGHEQQTIEGAELPCADPRCEGSPGGERFKVRVAVTWNRGRVLLFARNVRRDNEAAQPVWSWRLDEAKDIDLAAQRDESLSRVIRDIRDGGLAGELRDMLDETAGTLRDLWDLVKDQPWDDTRKSVLKTLAGARDLLERTK